MRNRQKIIIGESIKYIIMFLVLCIFFYFVPYTDDDLRWGSQIGLKRLNNGFAGYGGRYLGYLIVMGLTRSVIFKVLFMSAVIMILACLVRYLTRLEIAPYVVVLSIMVAPLSLFSSTIGWVSGFANYVTSVCFTLAYVAYIAYFDRKETKQQSVWMVIPLFLLGIINTLIVEHFSIYNVLLGITILLFYALKYKHFYIQFTGYVVGTLAGAWCMFSNSAYGNVLSGNDMYRDVGNGITIQSIYYGLYKICKYGYLDNLILNIVIFIVFCVVIAKYRENIGESKQRLVTGCLLINFAYLIAGILFKNILYGDSEIDRRFRFAFVGMTLLSVFAYIVIAAIFAKYYECFKGILFVLCSILIIDAPFLAVNPVTPRVFFGVYILYTVELCIMLNELCSEMKLFSETDIVKFCKMGVAVGAVFYIFIFSAIYKADCERLQDIRKQVEERKKKVVMYSIPYEQFVHNITLSEKWELRGYKKFYDLPKKLKIVGEKEEEK